MYFLFGIVVLDIRKGLTRGFIEACKLVVQYTIYGNQPDDLPLRLAIRQAYVSSPSVSETYQHAAQCITYNATSSLTLTGSHT